MILRICLVSKSWPSHQRSGLSLAAASHLRILAANGHVVSIIGSHSSVLSEQLPATQKFYVRSTGSGALYSPARVDRDLLIKAFQDCSPDLIIIEGWQTALTTAAVQIAFMRAIPTLMVSHGISLHPFSGRFTDRLRSLAWEPYKRFVLPDLIAKIDSITTLDRSASSLRFFDRDLSRRLGKTVLPLVNAPINWLSDFRARNKRKSQVLVIGYYSPIKNQLAALDVAARISSDLSFKFIGEKLGRYYEICVRRTYELGMGHRVVFMNDSECNLSEEISNSLVVLSTSVTEVLPLTLLEAMASGTPFVATPVGAVPFLEGGICAEGVDDLSNAVLTLIDDHEVWQQLSASGRRQHAERYTTANVSMQLEAAINAALRTAKARRKDLITKNL